MTFLLTLACTTPQDASTIERAIATAVPMAWVGTHAMDAYDGLPSECVVWETECFSAPCVGAFELIPDDEACPLPIAGQLDGSVTVTVSGSDEEGAALFGAYFGDLTSDGVDLWLESADGAIAARNSADYDDETTDTFITFTDLEVQVPDDDSIDVLEAAWVVLVDDQDTRGDVRDDVLTLQGSSQWVSVDDEVAGVKQTVLAEVELTPDCRRNPISGGGGVQNTGADGADDTTTPVTYNLVSVIFHEECDGAAEIIAAGTGGAQAGSFTLSLER